MKLYILLFFIPFWVSAQGINKNFEKNQSQKENKLQSEVFTRERFASSANTISQNNNLNKDIVEANQSIELETVVLKSKRNFKTKKYGFYKQDFFYSLFNFSAYNFYKGADSHRVGVYISHPQTDKKIFIKGVLLQAWSKGMSSLATIRVHLYPIDQTKKIIGYDLLKEEYTLQLDTKISLKTIDVSDEHIPFPQTGFLLTIEKVNNTGQPVVQMTKSNSGNSNSYYINYKKQKASKNTINVIPLGGINRNFKKELGLEQLDFMLGVSANVEK